MGTFGIPEQAVVFLGVAALARATESIGPDDLIAKETIKDFIRPLSVANA